MNYDACGGCGEDIAEKMDEVFACALCWRLVCDACVRKFVPASLYTVCSNCREMDIVLEALCKMRSVPLQAQRKIADFGCA